MFFKRFLSQNESGAEGSNGTQQQQQQQQQRQHSPSGSASLSPNTSALNLPAGVQLMNPELRKRLSSRTIQYNSKLGTFLFYLSFLYFIEQLCCCF